MKRSTWSAVALGLLVSAAAIATAAKAEPTVLTTAQLETVSAGQRFVNVNVAPPPVSVNTSPVQLNLNTTQQVAVATAVSIAVCAACKNALVSAASGAAATNINLANLRNF